MVDMWFVIVPALNFPPLFAVIYAAPLGVVTNVLPAIAYGTTELAIVRAIAKDNFVLLTRFIKPSLIHTINYY